MITCTSITVECDVCGVSEELEPEDYASHRTELPCFGLQRSQIEDAGWVFDKDGNLYCEECAPKS